jgi:hypothetical protein
MDPRYRADVIERSHVVIEMPQPVCARCASPRTVLLAALVSALGLWGCDNTPEGQAGLPDSGSNTTVDSGVDGGVDAGAELHASTPTIIRFQVKQVCVPGNQPEDGISVSMFMDVLDDQGTDTWIYRFIEYRNPDGGPGLLEATSPSLPPGNFSYPADLPVHVTITDTSPSFSFDLPFLAETYVLPGDGGQVFSGSKSAFIEPVDGGCP